MKRITRGLIALALSGAFALSAGVLVSDRSGATPTADDGWIVAGVAAAATIHQLSFRAAGSSEGWTSIALGPKARGISLPLVALSAPPEPSHALTAACWHA